MQHVETAAELLINNENNIDEAARLREVGDRRGQLACLPNTVKRRGKMKRSKLMLQV